MKIKKVKGEREKAKRLKCEKNKIKLRLMNVAWMKFFFVRDKNNFQLL